MDSDLLFNISLTLNGIKDSLNSSDGIKPFIPGVFAILGIILGFFLNFSKEFLSSKIMTIKYMHCINREINTLMMEAIENIEFLFETENNILEKKGDLALRSYAAMTFVCFDKFFPEVVSSLKDDEFITITKVYSTARLADNSCSTLSSLSTKHEDATEFAEKIHYLLSEFIHLYIVCDKYLNKTHDINHITHLDIALKLKIKGPYVEYLKSLKEDQSDF